MNAGATLRRLLPIDRQRRAEFEKRREQSATPPPQATQSITAPISTPRRNPQPQTIAVAPVKTAPAQRRIYRVDPELALSVANTLARLRTRRGL